MERAMQLRIRDGQLTLGSAYKLMVWGWILGMGTFMGGVFLLMVLLSLLTGQMGVNGEMVQGTGPTLLALAPGLIMLPIIIVLHAFCIGGIILFGLWLYRTRNPLAVTFDEQSVPQ
jgi:hypothetical protein